MIEELQKIHDYARENFVPIMDDDSVNIFVETIKKAQPFRILEIGTAVGYSTSLMALNSNATIDTIEINEERLKTAKELWKALSIDNRINAFLGDANDILLKVIGDNVYDMIFLDGPKSKYLAQLEICLPSVRSGGIIVADDVLFFGLVQNGLAVAHKHRTIVTKLREFLKSIQSNPSLCVQLLENGNGMVIIRKK